MQDIEKYRLFLLGPFRLLDPGGSDITPSGKKLKGLIAFLACPPGRIRDRMALQDKLWSTREPQNARDSLKKEISALRRLFCDAPGPVLMSQGTGIGLDPAYLWVDVIEGHHDETWIVEPEFLEGLDIRDPEFEDWLRIMRQSLSDGFAKSPAAIARTSQLSTNRLQIAVLPTLAPHDDDRSMLLADFVADRIAMALKMHELFDVYDLRADDAAKPRGAEITIRVKAVPIGRDLTLNLLANRTFDGELLLGIRRAFESDSFGLTDVAAFIAEFVDKLGEALLRPMALGESNRRIAALRAMRGIDMLLRLKAPSVAQAVRELEAAIEIDPRGTYLAWYAYTTVFRYEENKGRDLLLLRERADELAHRALEADPHNPITRSLLTHVYSFVFRDFHRADEMLRPIHVDPPDSPLYHHSRAALRLYTGNVDEARMHARKAWTMGQSNPYGYAFGTLLCMIDTVAGEFDGAIRHGERVFARAGRGDRVYGPLLRYLGTAYAFDGKPERALRVLRQLKEQTPEFSLEALKDDDYPVPCETGRVMMRKALKELPSF